MFATLAESENPRNWSRTLITGAFFGTTFLSMPDGIEHEGRARQAPVGDAGFMQIRDARDGVLYGSQHELLALRIGPPFSNSS